MNAATDDYEDPPSELVIEVGATAECITIATVNNGIYEETEAFLIVLSTTSDSVVITRTSTTVEITDNDGWYSGIVWSSIAHTRLNCTFICSIRCYCQLESITVFHK